MFKVLVVKEALGGNSQYQAAIKDRLAKDLENKLNSEDVIHVHSLSLFHEDGEFGLIAVAEVKTKAKK